MADAPPLSISGEDFYRRVVDALQAASIDFLLGGAFAMRVITGVERDTKDFDLMLRPRDIPRTLEACRAAGFRADYAFSHWIAKVHFGEHFIDLIYRAGNGLCEVDDAWFARSISAEVLGRTLRLCPPEEIIWQKAFVMERERFDGADVLHVLRSCASKIDWKHLVARFENDWPVLLSHLVLFGYVYPRHRDAIPAEVMKELCARASSPAAHGDDEVCQGTLLSRAQYLPDVERWGYRDARELDRCKMTSDEILTWTNAIDKSMRRR